MHRVRAVVVEIVVEIVVEGGYADDLTAGAREGRLMWLQTIPHSSR